MELRNTEPPTDWGSLAAAGIAGSYASDGISLFKQSQDKRFLLYFLHFTAIFVFKNVLQQRKKC